jgi:hypothetical protein
VQFTPSWNAEEQTEAPPKRPPSPFSGRPLRVKDLVPITLVPESSESNKYICPVSRCVISKQFLDYLV